MSTPSIIAIPDGDGFKGRYCHSDGYPTQQLLRLHKVITETFGGDIDAALQVLLYDNYGWSSLCAVEDPPEWYDKADERFKWVPNVGCAYTLKQDPPDLWCEYHGEDMLYVDAAWVYVIDPSSRRITVFYVDDAPHYVGGFNIDTLDLSDEHLTEIECGREWERCCHYAWRHFDNIPEECRKIGTREWLGLDPIDTSDFHNAIAVLYYGERFTLTGTGGCPRRFGEYDGRYWDAECIDSQGERRTLRIARRYKTVPSKPAKGVEWIFPQVPERA